MNNSYQNFWFVVVVPIKLESRENLETIKWSEKVSD